jgi:hypothetical protein
MAFGRVSACADAKPMQSSSTLKTQTKSTEQFCIIFKTSYERLCHYVLIARKRGFKGRFESGIGHQ